MSLQVWLPLNGDLHNQGLSEAVFSSNRVTIDTNGKIGKCYNFTSGSFLSSTLNLSSIGPWSACAWIYPTSDASSGHQYIIGLNTSTAGDFLFSLCLYQNKIAVRFKGTTYQVTDTYNQNTWYHACFTYDGISLKIYINGILNRTIASTVQPVAATNLYIGKRGGDTGYYSGKLNDVRIYDHCLSDKEVEEISKGLVLHYKLDGNGKGNDNILLNTYFDNKYTQTSGWDTTKNGTLLANSWGGYNPGVSNQATVYHAHLKEFEGQYVYEYIKTANETWLGISQGGLQTKLIAGQTYTFSWEEYHVDGTNRVGTGLYYYKTGATSANFHLGIQQASNITRTIGQWQKYSYTFIAPSDADYSKNIIWYIYGHYNNNGTFYMRHPKLELGDSATTWTPNPNDSIYSLYNDNIIYDSSGYNNNGEQSNITIITPSPRYSVATNFNGSMSRIEAEPLSIATKTISAWLKWDTIPAGSPYSIPIHDKQSGLAIGVFQNGAALISYVGSGAGGIGSCVSTSLTINTWYHIVVIKTSDTTRDVYINGIKATPASNNWWGGDLNKLELGCRHINGAYSGYFNGQIVDFRAYATALTPEQVKELYNTSMTIDNNGNIHARELVEK